MPQPVDGATKRPALGLKIGRHPQARQDSGVVDRHPVYACQSSTAHRIAIESPGMNPVVSLDDLVPLIRGGRRSLEPERVRSAACNAESILGLLAISVFADTDRELAALCRAHRALRVYGSLWVTTAERIRAAGFALQQTGRDPAHHSLILSDLEPSTLERLRGCFVLRPNPLPAVERRRL